MSGLEAAKISEDGNSRAQVAERVREIRRKKGLTIKDVATRSGLAISTVSKIERNLMAPTYDRFSRLADGLGVDVSELFMAKGEPFEKMRFDRLVSHEGEEFFFVLKGKVVVQLEGKDPVVLETGESIYFDSRRGHLYASAGDTDARILCVCTKM